MDKKNKKSKKERERVLLYQIFVIVLCVCIVGVILAVVMRNNSNSGSDDDSGNNDNAGNYVQVESNEQVYNSVDDLVMNKDTKEVTLNISNDADNAYNIKVTLQLDSGETLYESDMLVPGETLGTVTLDTDLTEGEYSVFVLLDSYSSSSGELVSGVVYTRTLTVE